MAATIKLDIPRLSIPEFYEGRDIFITGGTGFVGKVLVEKLLRSCPDINRIYLLCRPKRSRTPEERKVDFAKPPLFDVIKQENPGWLGQIQFVAGDVSELGLKLAPSDFKQLENVSIVFHVAASVRFDDPLSQAILLNVRGTHETIKLALTMKKLVSFVHISTTYFQPSVFEIEERPYKLDYDWRVAIKAAETLDERTMDGLSYLYTNNCPNTYCFAKGLGEQVCIEYADHLPITIYRPSIVTSSEREPIPVWTDSLNGPVALFIACAYGLMRTLYCRPDAEINYCPVDLCAKGMIISAWKRVILDMPSSEIDVYNCASIRVSTWSHTIGSAKKSTLEIPFHNIMWPPGGKLTTCKYHNYMRTIFYQVLPAIVLDFVLKLLGRPQHPTLMKTQRKILLGLNATQYFAMHSWNFHNDKYVKLHSYLKGLDVETFSLETTRETAVAFFLRSTIGWRRYLLNTSDDTIPEDRKRLQRMYVVHNTLVVCIYGLLLYAAYVKLVPLLLSFW